MANWFLILWYQFINQTAPNYLAKDLQWADTDDSRRRLRSATTRRLLVRCTRCCTGTARLERPACRHRFCTVTGHFQAALGDSSIWTIIRLTTDLVTCPWSFAYGRINTVVNNNVEWPCSSAVVYFACLIFCSFSRVLARVACYNLGHC